MFRFVLLNSELARTPVSYGAATLHILFTQHKFSHQRFLCSTPHEFNVLLIVQCSNLYRWLHSGTLAFARLFIYVYVFFLKSCFGLSKK
jgi:hypothetical protein